MFDVYSGSEVISSMFTRDRVYLIFCGWVDKFHPDWDVEKAGRGTTRVGDSQHKKD